MNFLRYEFSKESEAELLHFLNSADSNKQSNPFCDLAEYEKWKKIIPLNERLKTKALLEKATVDPNIINLDSDEEVLEIASQQKNEFSHSQIFDNVSNDLKLTVKDIAFAIKENLEIENCLSQAVLKDLSKVDEYELEQIFVILLESLNSEEIQLCGESLICLNETLICNLCRHLLIPKASTEFCPNLFILFEKVCVQHRKILQNELLSSINIGDINNNQILLQYLTQMKPDFQCLILSDFVANLEQIETESQLQIIAQLLNNQIDFDTTSQLIKIITPFSDSHTEDKTVGKLLMNIIEYLGPNLIHLQKPLKHLIQRHNSIWKAKLTKTLEACFEDSQMLSQTFTE